MRYLELDQAEDFRCQIIYCQNCRLYGRPLWEGAVRCLITYLFIHSTADCMGGPYEKELLKGLLTDYERCTKQSHRFTWWCHWNNFMNHNCLTRQNRPVLNESSPLVLTFGVTLQQIIDVVRTSILRKDFFLMMRHVTFKRTLSGWKKSAFDHLSLAEFGEFELLKVQLPSQTITNIIRLSSHCQLKKNCHK